MLKVTLDVTPSEPTFGPVLLVVLLAVAAAGTVIFALRAARRRQP